MSKGKSPLVLTIDDDELINQILSLRLKEMGYACKTYTNPQDFLKGIKVLEPDLCIVDLTIGKEGVGFLLIQAIRTSLDYHVPIVVISADGEIESIGYAMEVGADDYMVKPPKKDAFKEVINRYLAPHEHVEESIDTRAVPEDYRNSSINSDISISHIGEEGLYLLSPVLVATGVVITIRGEELKEITGVDSTVVSVARNWLDRNTGMFGLFVEFLDHAPEQSENARKYIKRIAG